jgi:hypothetical protein
VFTLATAVSCATGGPVKPATPPLSTEVEASMGAVSAFAWSMTHRLAWSDFRGPVPPAGSDEGAETVYSLFYGVRCTGKVFEFRVTAGFLPGRSWVRPAVKADPRLSSRTLHHEQSHFDLTEVYARRMRQYFGTLAEPCTRANDDLDAMATRFVNDERTEQARYDEETGHGLEPVRQEAWDRRIASDLKSLDAFAR